MRFPRERIENSQVNLCGFLDSSFSTLLVPVRKRNRYSHIGRVPDEVWLHLNRNGISGFILRRCDIEHSQKRSSVEEQSVVAEMPSRADAVGPLDQRHANVE